MSHIVAAQVKFELILTTGGWYATRLQRNDINYWNYGNCTWSEKR